MRIGGREVILNERIIIPKGETAELEIRHGSAVIPVDISFSEAEESSEPVNFGSENGRLKMKFSGFAGRSIASVLRRPFRLGFLDGQKFGFTFALSNVSGSHVLDLIVMVGGDFDEQ